MSGRSIKWEEYQWEEYQWEEFCTWEEVSVGGVSRRL